LYKTANLKELPKIFISSGMTLSELCEYLGVSQELIHEWERFFNLFPENASDSEKIYSQSRIKDFIKIKDSLDRGKPLHEIKRKIFKISDENMPANPFEKKNFPDFKLKDEDLTTPITGESLIRPFLSQINKTNEKIGELILEKARIIEETAIEKANLMSEIKILKTRNTDLVEERERLFAAIKKREELFQRSAKQESTLAESLKLAHDLLKQKEEDLLHIENRLQIYERELQAKDTIIHDQSQEINELLEERDKKWWHVIRDIFF